jgi:uncharacterized protein
MSLRERNAFRHRSAAGYAATMPASTEPSFATLSTVDELRSMYRTPSALVQAKVRSELDPASIAFIDRSPFVLVGSRDGTGGLDVSPRGGPPGFVSIVNDASGHTFVVLPDLNGNNLIDTFTNVVATKQAAMLFFVPGRGESLRVNGAAWITTDAGLLDTVRPPEFAPVKAALIVRPDQVFIHCAKAFKRSGIRRPGRLTMPPMVSTSWPRRASWRRPISMLFDPGSTPDTTPNWQRIGWRDLTLLVDACQWKFRDRLWCHLISDDSYDELHSFARRIGVPRIAFQGDHYDLHETNRARAIALGAVAVSGTELVRALKISGLRRGPALLRSGVTGVQHLSAPTLTTDRLVLRQWRPDDLDVMISLDQDPEVMHFVGGIRSPEKTLSAINHDSVSLALRGLGKWAVELRSSGELIGRVGLSGIMTLPIGPAVEIGWRLQRQHWGLGLASEAARAALDYGFGVLELTEIVAFTHSRNEASRAVMSKLAMTHDPTLDTRRAETTYELDDDYTVFYRLQTHVTQPPA